MNIKTSIEKAITQGGWKYDGVIPYFDEVDNLCIGRNTKGADTEYVISNHEILLDPTFWQALGKAEGWVAISKKNLEVGDSYYLSSKNDVFLENDDMYPLYLWKMHSMIDALAEGLTIEESFNLAT